MQLTQIAVWDDEKKSKCICLVWQCISLVRRSARRKWQSKAKLFLSCSNTLIWLSFLSLAYSICLPQASWGWASRPDCRVQLEGMKTSSWLGKAQVFLLTTSISWKHCSQTGTQLGLALQGHNNLLYSPPQLPGLGTRWRQNLDRQMEVYKTVVMKGGGGSSSSACSQHFQDDQSNGRFQQLR